MDLKKVYIYIYLSLISLVPGISQTNDSYYFQDFQIHANDTNKLFLQIENINFIKNNEYSGEIIKGQTLLGFNLSPKFVYYPSSKIKISAGGNFLSYYARENDVEASLLLSFQYKMHPKLTFVLGNIYGTINHRLIDPLYNFERYLIKNIEDGIQFKWDSDRIFADLWLDWEQQIFQDDPFQEKFNVGLSTDFVLINKENRYKLTLPFQNLFRHEGGQIDSYNGPLKTIFNNATGLNFSKSFNSKLIHNLNISSFIVNYQDLSPNKEQMYIDGMASYSSLELTNSSIDLVIGYWYGEQFIAPSGNPIYETYSRTKFYVEEPIRQLIVGKLNYQKNVFNGINLGFRYETFYDLLESNLEYSWTVMVVFNEKFFLKAF